MSVSLGQKIRAIRKEKMLSRSELAEKSGVTELTIKRIEGGKTGNPHLRTIRKIIRGLGLNSESFIMPRKMELSAQSLCPAIVDQVRALTRWDILMDRRIALRMMGAGIATSATVLAAFSSASAVASTHQPQGKLAPSDISDLETAAELFHRWYQQSGALSRKAVVGQIIGVADDLDENGGTNIEAPLQRVLALLLITAGSMSIDEGEQALGQQYYNEAVKSAQAAGDTELAADAMARLSWQYHKENRPDDAYAMIRAAQELVGESGSPRLLARLSIIEGTARADRGEKDAFLRVMDRAENYLNLDDGTDNRYWLEHINPISFRAAKGARWRDLAGVTGNTRYVENAVPLLESALEERPSTLRRLGAIDRAELALSYFDLGQLDDAARLAQEATAQAKQVRSAIVDERIAEVRNKARRHPQIEALLLS